MSAPRDPSDVAPSCYDCLDCGVGEACYCTTPRRRAAPSPEEMARKKIAHWMDPSIARAATRADMVEMGIRAERARAATREAAPRCVICRGDGHATADHGEPRGYDGAGRVEYERLRARVAELERGMADATARADRYLRYLPE